MNNDSLKKNIINSDFNINNNQTIFENNESSLSENLNDNDNGCSGKWKILFS